MNPFIDNNFTPNSSRARYNRRKHDDSYLSRVSYNTVEWINHQSMMEKFAYLLILIVFVIIFTAIYFIYTEHYLFQSSPLIMDNSTLLSSELVMPTIVTHQTIVEPKTTTIKMIVDGKYHGHRDGHHPMIIMKVPDEPTTETSSTITTKVVLTTETQATVDTFIASSTPRTIVTLSTRPPETSTTTPSPVPTQVPTISTPLEETTTSEITSTLEVIADPQLTLSTRETQSTVDTFIASAATISTPKTIVTLSTRQPSTRPSETSVETPSQESTKAPTISTPTPFEETTMSQSTLEITSTLKVITDPQLKFSTTMTPTDIRNKFNDLIDKKIGNFNEPDDLSDSQDYLSELAMHMKKRNQSIDLCSFMGFNHLSIPGNNADYYWFKPQSAQFNSDDLDLWDGFNPVYKDTFPEFNQPKSTLNKLNQFWDSCVNPDQNITDFRKLINKLGFNSYLPNNISGPDMSKLLKLLDYQSVFNFKPIPDHLNCGGKIILVERDDHPFMHNLSYTDLMDEFLDQIKYLNESWDDLNQEIDFTLAESLALSDSIQNGTRNEITQRINLNPKPFDQLKQYNFKINVTVDADYLIECDPGYAQNTIIAINDVQPIDLYYYLLISSLKKNLIHLDLDSIDLYYVLFDSGSRLNRSDFCRNMVNLPFGLISLTDHLIRSNERMDLDLLSVQLANHLMDKLIATMVTKLSPDKSTSKLIKDLCFVIFEQLAVNQISFNADYIDRIYSSLQMSDNYFDNVQSVRSWIRSGYKQGCLINYASI